VAGERRGIVQLSVLDRLMDDEPGRQEPEPTFAASVDRMRAAILRDVEWLLNTRQTPHPVPLELTELRRSVHLYGLPDITSLSGDAPTVRKQLAREVEELLRLFEPRLEDPRVTPQDLKDRDRRRLRFVIEGTLLMDPTPERVVFDTVLETASGRFKVNG